MKPGFVHFRHQCGIKTMSEKLKNSDSNSDVLMTTEPWLVEFSFFLSVGVLNLFYQLIWHPDVERHNKRVIVYWQLVGYFIIIVSLCFGKNCNSVMCCNGNDGKSILHVLIYDTTDDSFEFDLYNDFCVSYRKMYVSLHTESKEIYWRTSAFYQIIHKPIT